MAPGASLLVALQLNHQGATLLEQGDYKSAGTVLYMALKVTREQQKRVDIMSKHDEEDEDEQCCPGEDPLSSGTNLSLLTPTAHGEDEDEDEEDSSCSSARHDYHETIDTNISLVSPSRTLADMNDGPMQSYRSKSCPLSSRILCSESQVRTGISEDFIFRVPARAPVPCSGTEDGSISMMAVSCAILYNLGLTQHLRAIEERHGLGDPESFRQQTKRLHAALQLYELVFALQETGALASFGSLVTPDGQLPFLHILGLVNNCGQAYKALHNHSKADQLFQHLLTTLMLYVIGDEEQPPQEEGEDEDDDVLDGPTFLAPHVLEGFFASTSHLVLREPSVARAA